MTIEINIPTLQTERLILRAPGPQDTDRFVAFFSSERSTMVGGPVDEREAWRFLGSVIGHWVQRGFGRWILEDKVSGASCGLVGLHHPPHWPEPELGWILFNGAEGRGLATEAADAARQYAYDVLGLTTLISMIAPENTASIAVAKRLAAWRDGEFDNNGQSRQIWRHPSASVPSVAAVGAA